MRLLVFWQRHRHGVAVLPVPRRGAATLLPLELAVARLLLVGRLLTGPLEGGDRAVHCVCVVQRLFGMVPCEMQRMDMSGCRSRGPR